MEEVYVKVSELELKNVVGYYEEQNKDIVSIWELINDLDDMIYENKILEEENEDLKENQKTFNPYREYGISKKDFY